MSNKYMQNEINTSSLTTSQQFTLSAETRSELEAFVLMHRSQIMAYANNPEAMQVFLKKHGHEIPTKVVEQAKRFKTGETDIFLFRNVSVVEGENLIPSTPENSANMHSDIRDAVLTEPTMVLLSFLAGAQFNTDTEVNFLHVIPMRGYEEINNMTASHYLAPHTDSIGLPRLPEVTVVGCIRGQEEAKTRFYRTVDVLKNLDEKTTRVLINGQFTFRGGRPLTKPIIDGDIIRCSPSLYAENDQEREALHKLRQAIEDVEPIDVSLAQGDVLLWRNDKYLHSRTSVKFLEGRDAWQNRWLVRVNGYSAPNI